MFVLLSVACGLKRCLSGSASGLEMHNFSSGLTVAAASSLACSGLLLARLEGGLSP